MNSESAADAAGPRRIVVIGCPGAGKSTLSLKMAEKFGLPVVHLDQLWWLPNWKETTKADFDRRLADVLRERAWIIDGNYTRTLSIRLAESDLVVWLDYGRLLCLSRVLLRRIRSHGRTRVDMTPGCPERIDLEFLLYIWSFRAKVRPGIVAALEAGGGNVRIVRLTSPQQTERFLSTLT